MATKWDTKRRASYDALVDSANRCFHDRGYAATRVEDIVEGTGYTKGAFYFHFPNKLECFWHVCARRNARRGEWWRVIESADPSTTGVADALALAFARFAQANDGHDAWVLVAVDVHQQHRGDADVTARLRDLYAVWTGEIERFVTALRDGGWLAPDVDVAPLARRMFAYGEGLIVHGELYAMPDREIAFVTGLAALLAPYVAVAAPA